jgi:hypothetical protein
MDMTTVSFELGREELLFLLRIMRVETLPGLGDAPFSELSESELNALLAAGFNSLRARGWVTEGTDERPGIGIESALIALIGTCAMSNQIIFLSRQPIDGPPEATYVHLDSHLTAIHELAHIGVHRLIASVDPRATLAHIVERLQLHGAPSTETQPIRLTNETLTHVSGEVREQRFTSALEVLDQAGVPPSSAQAFVESLATMRANSTVAHLRFGDSGRLVQGLSLIDSPSGFWALTSESNESTAQVLAELCSADTCIERIAPFLALS